MSARVSHFLRNSEVIRQFIGTLWRIYAPANLGIIGSGNDVSPVDVIPWTNDDSL